jgi:DNA-binding beta-propeller fold protein YncE
MNFSVNRPERYFSRIPFFLLILLSACASQNVRQEPNNLFWPMPPDQPRIKYIQSVYSEDDIGRVYSFKEQLFGKDYFDALVRPYGVYARRGNLYVADLQMRGIMIFNYAEKRIRIAASDGAVQSPVAVAADESGTIYAADVAGGKIGVYDARGIYRTSYLLEGSKPVALTVHDPSGRLYIADRAKHEVVVLGLDGKKLFTIGGPGEADGKFNIPLGVAVDKAGDVYVLDSGNFRVQIFDSAGNFLSKFGAVGDSAGKFANPKGIAVDSEGHIYVTDAAFGNFQIFDREGHALLYVGRLGPAPGQFHLPGGITIDENDRIYVADQLNRRVEVFQYLKAP